MQESTPTLRNALLSAGLIAIAVLVYWPSTSALWGYWTDENFGGTHGLLIAPLAAWLLFRARYRLAAVQVSPSRCACALLVLCSVAWLVFWRAGLQTLHILLLPALMGLAVFAALGYRAMLIAAFPIGYLYFAVPAWGIFVAPLQDLTIHAIAWLAPLIGVHEQIRGNLVVMPGVGIFEIARGCSGANFLTVGLAVAALLGELERASLFRRALLLGVMGVLAVISNWLRVLIIVDAGYTTHMRHVLVSRGHYTFGWVLFTAVMVAFVWVVARPATSAARTPAFPHRSAFVVKMSAGLAAGAALVAAPLTFYMMVSGLDSSGTPLAFVAPAGQADWKGPIRTGDAAWKPDFVGPHSQWYVAYQGPAGHNIDMVAIGYSSQAQGRELVSEENSLFGTSNVTAVAEHTVTLEGQSYIEAVEVDEHGRRSLVWSVYDIGGREFVTPLLSQLWYGIRSLGGAPYSVLFAFRSECAASCEVARDTLRSFVQTMHPGFTASVTRTPRSNRALRPA